MARYRPHHSLGRCAAIRYVDRWIWRHFSTRKTCKHQKITDTELTGLLLSGFVFKVPHASSWWSLLREDQHGLPSSTQADTRSVRLLAQLETLVSTAEHLAEVIIDAMSLPICRPKRTKHCTFPGARWGYGTQKNFYGDKVHAWVTRDGKIVQYALRPANLHDLTVGFELNGRWPEFGGPKIIGDKGDAALGFVFPPKNTHYDTGWRETRHPKLRKRIETVFSRRRADSLGPGENAHGFTASRRAGRPRSQPHQALNGVALKTWRMSSQSR